MEFLACVNARYFAGIQIFAAQQDVRYYLKGVYIEPHRSVKSVRHRVVRCCGAGAR